MADDTQIISRINLLKVQLNRIEAKVSVPKALAECYICRKEKGLYTTVGYGSRYDGVHICPACLDDMIGRQMQSMCKGCHKPLLQEQVVARDGCYCLECWNKQ